jgi:hypothetical protein
LIKINRLMHGQGHCAQFYPQKLFTSCGVDVFQTVKKKAGNACARLLFSCAWEKSPYESSYLASIEALAHTFIHRNCAEQGNFAYRTARKKLAAMLPTCYIAGFVTHLAGVPPCLPFSKPQVGPSGRC